MEHPYETPVRNTPYETPPMEHPYERPNMKQHLRLQVRKLSEEGDDEDREEGQEANEDEKPSA